MSQVSSRLPLLDTAKGLACAAIVAHHLAFYGPMSDIAQPLAPDLMAWLYDYARMAVQIFLVLGGYLAAASLAPEGVARFDSAGQQVGKRFVRLVVPYVVALLVTVLVSALVRPWFDHPSVPGDPDVAQLLIRRELFMRPHRRHACRQSTSGPALACSPTSSCVLSPPRAAWPWFAPEPCCQSHASNRH